MCEYVIFFDYDNGYETFRNQSYHFCGSWDDLQDEIKGMKDFCGDFGECYYNIYASAIGEA